MKRTSAQLKALARQSLNGHWGIALGAYLLYLLFSIILVLIITGISDPYSFVGVITNQILLHLVLLLFSLVLAGYKQLLLDMNRKKNLSLGTLFCVFSKHPDRFLVVNLILLLAQVIVSLPLDLLSYRTDRMEALYFLLGSILAASLVSFLLSLFFGLSNYILLDNLEIGAIESMKKSLSLMRGNKGRFFRLYLSFFPLSILCVFTCYIGFLWLQPYIETTLATFYMEVTGELDRPGEEASLQRDYPYEQL